MTNNLFIINGHKYTVKHRLPLIKNLIKNNHKVTIATPSDSDAYVYLKKIDLDLNVIHLHNYKSIFSIFTHISNVLLLIKIHRKKHYSNVLSFTILPNIYGIFFAFFPNVKNIATFTGLGSGFDTTIKSTKQKFLTKIVKIMHWLITHLSHTIIVQNGDDFTYVNKINTNANVNLIPGSGIECSNDQIKKISSINHIGFCSRLTKDKGIDDFLEISKLFRDKIFHICGAIDLNNPSSISEKEYENLFNLPNVKYWGELENVNEFYNSMDLLLFLSIREGLPKTILEAADSLLPVVAYDVPGVREIICHENTGFLVPYKDRTGLEDVIRRISNNVGALDAIQKAGKEAVNKKFSIEVVSNSYLNIINS